MDTFEIGERVAVSRATRDGHIAGTVVKVTFSGQTSVRVGNRVLRFTAQGREIGGSTYWSRNVFKMTPALEESISKTSHESIVRTLRGNITVEASVCTDVDALRAALAALKNAK